MFAFRLFAVLVMQFLIVMPVAAQAPWPDFMPTLEPFPSNSPVKAEFPANLTITPPAADLPPAVAAWSGKWEGYACSNYSCDTRLAVTDVRADSVSAVYTYAFQNIRRPIVHAVELKIVGNELVGNLPSGSFLAYRRRGANEVEFKWSSVNGKEWSVGLLTKDGVLSAVPEDTGPTSDLVKPFVGQWRGEWIFSEGYGRASAELTVKAASDPRRVFVTYVYNGVHTRHWGQVLDNKLRLDFGNNVAEYALTASESQLSAIYLQRGRQTANAVMRRQ